MQICYMENSGDNPCVQFCAQLVHVASCDWWRGDPPPPLHQPQLAMWASYAHSCGTRITHVIYQLYNIYAIIYFLLSKFYSFSIYNGF